MNISVFISNRLLVLQNDLKKTQFGCVNKIQVNLALINYS